MEASRPAALLQPYAQPTEAGSVRALGHHTRRVHALGRCIHGYTTELVIEIVSVIVNSDGYGDGDSHDFVALRAQFVLKSSRGFKLIRLKFQHWVLGMIQGAFKTKTGRGSWGGVI